MNCNSFCTTVKYLSILQILQTLLIQIPFLEIAGYVQVILLSNLQITSHQQQTEFRIQLFYITQLIKGRT
jgi:hypothetical protein